jgi:hypothetical protein
MASSASSTWAGRSTNTTRTTARSADESEERVRQTYGANFERLVEVKRRYDSDNLFRANRNIRPHG